LRRQDLAVDPVLADSQKNLETGALARHNDRLRSEIRFKHAVAGSMPRMASPEERNHPSPVPPEPVAELPAPIYQELRRLAAQHLRKERSDHTLRTTALAHEAYLRLAAEGELAAGGQAAFCAAAAQAIRRILVDYARRRGRLKRGGAGQRRVRLESAVLSKQRPVLDLLDLDEALQRLERIAPRLARVVELRFFGGLSEEETAETLGLARRTVQNDWRGARAWLRRELRAGGAAEAVP
jgi:RNA polymerase sigma factor (TIGR02999 family)